MILGLFLRNYKCYKGARFLSFSIDKPQNLNVFIGNNGVGKSSILEALDTFFNGREWTLHYDSKKSEAFVAPLFLYKKDMVKKMFTKTGVQSIEIISDSLWEILMNSNSSFKSYEAFFELRDNLTQYRETHCLFTFSKIYSSPRISFPFDKYIKGNLKLNGVDTALNFASKLKEEFTNNVTYLYIPVETSISEFLRLETKELQDLMNVDIKQNISKALNEKRITRSYTGAANRNKKISLMDIINENLENFVNDVEETIQTIDREYNFSQDDWSKKKLTANHITKVIIEAYFSKRRLRKSKKSIHSLSAGERKRALIDIAYTFLSSSMKNESKKEVILAIDEPESSLHISQCYEQFNKICTITEQLDVQVLITTHWYGSLPIFQTGVLNHIDGNNEAPINTLFNLENYFEERGSHPNDVQLKSFYDLSSSILSSTKLHNTNWLLVEGSVDKKYLDYFLNEKNIKVLPLGSCSIVKMIYEYLYLPISQKSENKSMEGKVFCLIDTDTNGTQLNISDEGKVQNNLLIRRLQFDESKKEIILKKVNDGYRTPTEIEESLDPKQFYDALALTIKLHGGEDVIEAFDSFEFDKAVKTSSIKGDYSILSHQGGKKENGDVRSLRMDKEKITDFIDSHKEKIAQEYVKMSAVGIPEWINEVKKFFSVDKKMKLFKTIT